MLIGVAKEYSEKETRIAMIPEAVKKLKRSEGIEISIELGLGNSCGYSDNDYVEAGAKIVSSREEILKSSDLLLRVGKPLEEEISLMKKGAISISFLDPFNEVDLIKKLKESKISAVSMEMIPRTTLAQKMDALSSQASLAGYVAVTVAAERLNKIFPMMMTPAGTISPSKVFVIGAGVAGLQAIATAKRLGARVEAFDTRPVVEEQVNSLGAKFLKVDLGEMGQTAGGYAKELSKEQLEKQQKAMAKACMNADIVITTAKLFGRKAPIIIKKDVVEAMKSGSIIVDLAAETGGNVEGTIVDEIVNIKGTEIIGYSNLEGRVQVHASQMYSSNLVAFIEEFWNRETKKLELNSENEIIAGALITKSGEIVNSRIKEIIEGGK